MKATKSEGYKHRTFYYVGLYSREVMILEGQREGSNVEETKTMGRGGGAASPS